MVFNIPGYVEITVIPAGARNIVLDELVASQNYLAISNASGHDLLNMDWYIDWSGEYQAAGTIISYERIDNKERVEILGPISEPLHIYVNRGFSGILYMGLRFIIIGRDFLIIYKHG